MSDKNHIGISRRKILAGLGTIGVASAGAGLGTSAYFSDTESFEGNMMTAGELNLAIDYDSAYFSDGNAVNEIEDDQSVEVLDGEENIVIFNLTDVKPGDKAAVEFCFQSVNNPAYIWMCSLLNENAQGAITEPEKDALEGYSNISANNRTDFLTEMNTTTYGTGDWGGQLAQSMDIEIGYSQTTCEDGTTDEADVGDAEDIGSASMSTITSGKLAMLASGLSIPLDSGGNQSIDSQEYAGNQTAFNASDTLATEGGEFACPCLRMELSVSDQVGNEIQADSVSFTVGFAAYQDRHNDGTQSPCGFPDDPTNGDNGDGGFGGEWLNGS